jgi:hypothetical protein
MKLFKLLPLLLLFTLFNTNVIAQEDCSQIKNNSSVNILKKLKCKAGMQTASKSESSGEKKSTWKIWKKPEWMKKKN